MKKNKKIPEFHWHNVYCFGGYSGSGKTTLIEKLIPLLIDKGCSVAAAKATHHAIELDTPGKDSWRLKQAGASMVTLVTPERIHSTENLSEEKGKQQVIDSLSRTFDIVLIEGFSELSVKSFVFTNETDGILIFNELEEFHRNNPGEIAKYLIADLSSDNKQLTHVDEAGNVKMVNVGAKRSTKRRAVASGSIRMKPETLAKIVAGETKKGSALTTAQLAGIMAAKKTSDLIPLCHTLPLDGVDIRFHPRIETGELEVVAEVSMSGKTGVEMEALTAVSVACLTIYDMAKALQKDMVIEKIELIAKSGGKTGRYQK